MGVTWGYILFYLNTTRDGFLGSRPIGISPLRKPGYQPSAAMDEPPQLLGVGTMDDGPDFGRIRIPTLFCREGREDCTLANTWFKETRG